MSNVKLLGLWASPLVMRVHIALTIKSVSYEYLEESFGSKSELLLQSNPIHNKVPVLIIQNDKPICESLIIVEYVNEAWPSDRSILPSQPYDRAIARFWATYLDEKWFPALKCLLFEAKDNEERKGVIKQLEEGLGLIEDAYNNISNNSTNPFFGGNHIGFLDIAFGCFLGWIKVTNTLFGLKLLDHAKTPGLAQWAQRFCEDCAVKPFMPETDKLLEFANFLIVKMAPSTPS